MHVLVIPSWYPEYFNPTRGFFFHEQVRALKNEDVNVGVICSDITSLRNLSWKRFFYYQKKQFVNDFEIPTYHSMTWNWLPFFHHLMQPQLVAKGVVLYEEYVENHGKPNIVHAHSVFPAGLIALEIKKRFGVPFVITEHSSAFGRGLLTKRQKVLARNCFELADCRGVVSFSLQRDIHQSLETSFDNWKLMPNITSLYDDFATGARGIGSKQSVGSGFSFLNIAMMTPNKGQDKLIKAFAKSYGGKDNIVLRIGGDGPIRKSLENLAFQLGVSSQVLFLGALSRRQVAEEMIRCNAYVLSSYYETFGVALIEALSFGNPTISTACGGPEFIVNSKNGVLVTVGDVNELAAGMEYIKEHYREYDSKMISEETLELFGRKAIVSQLLSEYNQILDSVG